MAKAKWKTLKGCVVEGDLLITDPCYLRHGGSKFLDDYDNWEPWIESHGGIMSQTFYGDWGCTVFRVPVENGVGNIPDDAEALGEFCADSGTVCAVPLDEVRKESPGFEDWLKGHGWCGTIIRGFKGQVRFMTRTTWHTMTTKTDGKVRYKDVELRVCGSGNVEFESVQTSL